MQYEPVVCLGDDIMRQVLHQLHFYTVRGGAALGNKPYAVAYAEHVCVHCHGALVPHDRQYDIGSLASHARQGNELLQCVGHLASEVAAQFLCHTHKVFRLVVGVGYALYVVVDFIGVCLCHLPRVGVACYEVGGHHVHALVGALRR